MKKNTNGGVTNLKKSVDALYKTVYQGNGKPSILLQLAQLEEQVKSIKKDIENYDEDLKLKIVDVANSFNDKIQSLDREISLKFKNVTDVVTEKFNNLSEQINSEFSKEQKTIEHKWNFKTAFSTSILASFTSICVVVVSEILKRIH